MESVKGQEPVLSIVQTGANHSGPRQDVNALLQAEASKLSQRRQDMETCFESLFSLCENYLLKLLSEAATASSARSAYVDNFTTILSLIFHKSPFYSFSDDSSLDKFVPVLAMLNSRSNSDVNYPTIMTNEARRWVDDYTGQLSPNSQLTSVSNRYLQLLTGFSVFLDTEISALPPDNPLADLSISPSAPSGISSWVPDRLKPYAPRWLNGDASDSAPSTANLEVTEARETRQQTDILRGIHNLVKKEIDRERTRKFSVALCGMVKSG